MTSPSLQPKFIKPFSKGQITLPKNYRDYLGINENSWLKISLSSKQILVQPVAVFQETRIIKPKLSLEFYKKALLGIKGDWFEKKDFQKTREKIEKRLEKNEKSLA